MKELTKSEKLEIRKISSTSIWKTAVVEKIYRDVLNADVTESILIIATWTARDPFEILETLKEFSKIT